MRFAVRCLASVVALTGLLGIAVPGVAFAHAGGAPSASNYQTRLFEVSPAVSGLSFEVKALGDKVQVINNTGQEVTIPGYGDEPYLRIGRDGVFENVESPTLYANADRYGTQPAPDDVDPANPPQWKKVSGGNSVTWHDHRVHWMSTADPPQVRNDPGKTYVLYERWQVPVVVGETRVVASGDLRWVPAPSPTAPIVVAGATALALLALGRRSTALAVRIALGTAVAANAFHVVGALLVAPGTWTQRVSDAALSDLPSIFVWVVGLVAIWKLASGKAAWPDFAAVFASAALLLIGGLGDMSAWWNSQVDFEWGEHAARVAIALTLGSSVVATALAAIRVRKPAAPAAS